MSSIAYLGRQMRSFESAPQFDGFSRVVITVSENLEYSAGTDTGRTLTLVNPWGTQAMADNILKKIKGFQYQPYKATGAILDPASELGDGVTANNVYSGIYSRKETFGSLYTATISAPEDEEIDHEFEYVSKQERTITRNKAELTAKLLVQADQIAAEVKNRETSIKEVYAALTIQADRITQEVKDRKSEVESLTAKLQVQADEISAKVSKTGGASSSFGWSLTDSTWTLTANNSTVLKATKSGIEVSGKITATSGKIGGFDIQSNYLSYNNQTWGGTNTSGIYVGPNGIQLGKYFKVDSAGNLTASSGNFTGTVHAGNISYGGDSGYFSGSGITGNSIYGNRLAYSTIGSSYLSGGVNTSLGYADSAYSITAGWETANEMSISNLYAGTARVSNRLYLSGAQLYLGSITVNGVSYNVVRWTS